MCVQVVTYLCLSLSNFQCLHHCRKSIGIIRSSAHHLNAWVFRQNLLFFPFYPNAKMPIIFIKSNAMRLACIHKKKTIMKLFLRWTLLNVFMWIVCVCLCVRVYVCVYRRCCHVQITKFVCAVIWWHWSLWLTSLKHTCISLSHSVIYFFISLFTFSISFYTNKRLTNQPFCLNELEWVERDETRLKFENARQRDSREKTWMERNRKRGIWGKSKQRKRIGIAIKVKKIGAKWTNRNVDRKTLWFRNLIRFQQVQAFVQTNSLSFRVPRRCETVFSINLNPFFHSIDFPFFTFAKQRLNSADLLYSINQ